MGPTPTLFLKLIITVKNSGCRFTHTCRGGRVCVSREVPLGSIGLHAPIPFSEVHALTHTYVHVPPRTSASSQTENGKAKRCTPGRKCGSMSYTCVCVRVIYSKAMQKLHVAATRVHARTTHRHTQITSIKDQSHICTRLRCYDHSHAPRPTRVRLRPVLRCSHGRARRPQSRLSNHDGKSAKFTMSPAARCSAVGGSIDTA